jgi:hypothetical protein
MNRRPASRTIAVLALNLCLVALVGVTFADSFASFLA